VTPNETAQLLPTRIDEVAQILLPSAMYVPRPIWQTAFGPNTTEHPLPIVASVTINSARVPTLSTVVAVLGVPANSWMPKKLCPLVGEIIALAARESWTRPLQMIRPWLDAEYRRASLALVIQPASVWMVIRSRRSAVNTERQGVARA